MFGAVVEQVLLFPVTSLIRVHNDTNFQLRLSTLKLYY